MNTRFFRVKCLTNLHMGGGDVNYSVIDLEVERDPVLGEPTMNASGVKGAIRDFCEARAGKDSEQVKFIFGSRGSGGQPGSYSFFSGDLLARPVRISGGEGAYVLATTPELIGHFVEKATALGVTGLDQSPLPAPRAGNVLCGRGCVEVEGLPATKSETPCTLLEQLLGTDNWALMTTDDLFAIDLPVQVHNLLADGDSKNLWYTQVVPHESVFGLLISGPDGDAQLEELLGAEPIVQFGGGASTGNGYARLEQVVGHE